MKTATVQSGHARRATLRERRNRRAATRQPVPPSRTRLRLLRQSFARLEAQTGIAGLVFYRTLFSLDPSLQPLFRTSIDLQARKFMESLRCTVRSLENPRELVPILEAMGRRHVGYGALARHYEIVLKAALLTFGEVLQGAFTPEMREAWREALLFVSNAMQRGAARAVPRPRPRQE